MREEGGSGRGKGNERERGEGVGKEYGKRKRGVNININPSETGPIPKVVKKYANESVYLLTNNPTKRQGGLSDPESCIPNPYGRADPNSPPLKTSQVVP